MLIGSGINSNLKFVGTGFQRSTTPGRMQMISTQTMVPRFWKMATRTSTSKLISIGNTLVPQGKPIHLPLEDSQLDDDVCTVSPWGHGPLVGGTVIISHLFLFLFPLFRSALLCSDVSTCSADHVFVLGSATPI
jgi:hypothetical protein